MGHNRRDIFGSVQTLASQATGPGIMDSTLIPDIKKTVGGAASQVTAALSSIVSEAASIETSVISQGFATNYTVGTKYACAGSSCGQIPSLEVVLCFGLFITGISVITSALAFYLPFMKLLTVGCSMLATLFFIVFTACTVSIVQIGSLVAKSTIFAVERGAVYAEALWVLGGAVVLAFSAVGIFLMSLL